MAEVRRRIVIVEDQTLMREGLRMLLSAQIHLEVVGEGVDGREAVHLAGQLQPELMVLSLTLPGFDGPESLRAVRSSFMRWRRRSWPWRWIAAKRPSARPSRPGPAAM